MRVDLTALGFTVAVAIATGLLFGMAPALQISAGDVHEGLKETRRGSSEGRRGGWVRSGLVVVEVALACMLLVGAGLLMRSFLHVMDVDLGFQPAHAAIWTIETGRRFQKNSQQEDFYRRIERAMLAIPGIESAGVSDCLPLGRNRNWGVGALGETYPPDQYPLAFPRIVDEGYLRAMRIPLRAGRDFSEHDTEQSEQVVLINETLARRLWPGRDPVGQQVRSAGPNPWRVVGVVGNVRHSSLEEPGGSEIYLPVTQIGANSVELVVRGRMAPEAMAAGVRAALKSVDPTLPSAEFRTLEGVVERAVSPRRFVMVLLGGFAGLALILASLGIYGVVSYAVTQRTQEIGIRMALGASAGQVRIAVMRQTVGLALAGAVIGTIGAVGVSRLLESLLYGVKPGDALTFAGVLLLLTTVAAVAGYLPARRASRIDPMVALRLE